MSLFFQNRQQYFPLAEKMRPKNLEDVIGQEHLTGEGAPLRQLIQSDGMTSFILWGTPGTGKTTLARIFADHKKSHFESFSAVMQGVKDIRSIAKESEDRIGFYGEKTILFIDEIHRLSKSQQDVLLPFLERGTFYIIGATTENPSFSLNSAVLSRVRVFLLKSLRLESLEKILSKGSLFLGKTLEKDAVQFLLNFANGDARTVLNVLEASALQTQELVITRDHCENVAQQKVLRFDRDGDEHHQVISAFIKSMRASDVDATVYYLARLIEGGEDPRFIARRMVIFASEDIGIADKNALPLAMSTYAAAEKIGMPEIRIPLSHVAIFLAKAPKNDWSYRAINAALEEVQHSGNLPIPLHLRNASTPFLRELGFGKGYVSPHEDKKQSQKMKNLPKEIEHKGFFEGEL